jgi:hypothetical protein
LVWGSLNFVVLVNVTVDDLVTRAPVSEASDTGIIDAHILLNIPFQP